jgi:hypothetical protein
MVLPFLLVFMDSSGHLCISTRSEAHSARSQAALQDAPLARMMVTDSGHKLREFINAQPLRAVPENSPPLRAVRRLEPSEKTRHA